VYIHVEFGRIIEDSIEKKGNIAELIVGYADKDSSGTGEQGCYPCAK
jgi:hypothetical protein